MSEGTQPGPNDLETAVRLRGLKARLLEFEGPPLCLGRFTLDRVLGRGAMGVVFLGHDHRLDRPVAIKLLRGEGGEGGARLEREARALARLNHPHVVTIHEVGEHAGRTFLAMEYVDGPNLRAWMSSPQPLELRIEMLRQATSGLRAAHAIGLVHRDLKPHNMIVGADGRLRIADFGLATEGARAESTSPTERGVSSRITVTGARLGTPAYMAPELLRGEPSSTASDQFALCCVGWELLFARYPFEDRDRDDPPPGGPDALSRVLAQGLAADPRRRHADLEPILAACTGPRPRRRGIAIALGALAPTLAALWWWQRPEPAGAIAAAIEAAPVDADCHATVDSDDSRRTLTANLENARAEVTSAGSDPASLERAAVRVARFELALGRWSTACERLDAVMAANADAALATCWHRRFCGDASALPARARCFGGDVEQCTKLAIKHEYEVLDATQAQAEHADPASAASVQLHLAHWSELKSAACDAGDAASCNELARGLGSP